MTASSNPAGRKKEQSPRQKRGASPSAANREVVASINEPPTEQESLPSAKWFAVYTTPRHEKRVDQYLSAKNIEHYLPLYHQRRRWSDGTRVTLDLPLFPGYLFVRIDKSERVRVLEVPGVLSIVGGTGHKPAALPDAEIEALRSGLHLRRPEPCPLPTVGERVRIRSGPLAGMQGVVLRYKNRLRVVLTIELIRQSVAVEVEAEELEALEPENSALAIGHAS